MRASNRTLPLVLAASFYAATNGAMAGPQSMLDPYAYVPPPRPIMRAPKARTAPAQRPTPNAALPRTSSSAGGGGVVDGVKQVGDGIVSTTKAAGGAVVNGTKAVGSGFFKGGKVVSDGVVNGSKTVGGGIAAGAKMGGGALVSGAQAVGHGFASLGGKLKDGTAAAGGKIAAAPKVFKKADKPDRVEQNIADAPEPKPSAPAAPLMAGSAPLRDSINTPAPAAAPRQEEGGGVLERVTAMPKAIGGGIKSAASTTGKVVAAPFRKVGQFFGHGADEAPRATAQGPGTTK